MKTRKILDRLSTKLGIDKPQLMILALIAFIIVWVIGNSAYNFVNNSLVRTYVVESEFEKRDVKGYAFLQTENSLMASNYLGSIKKIKNSGSRVAKNHLVFSVLNEESGSKREFYVPISGILSYKVDGYETLRNLQNISGLDFSKIYQAQNKLEEKTSVNEKGERVAKVIDNLKPVHLFMEIPKSEKPIFEKVGDIVRIDFSELGETTKAEVVGIKENSQKDGYSCEFELLSASDKLLSYRILVTEVYILKEAILEISPASIVPNKEDLGVYILNDGIVSWRPLEIIEKKDGKYFAKTLPEGTEIILNPDRVDVGDIL